MKTNIELKVLFAFSQIGSSSELSSNANPKREVDGIKTS
jgi:hypothetical protein